ncbi:hypothetical protein ICN19_02000 [Polynucleobacter sp. AP-Capit-er-40B-B4]|uniref:hypothetical protein n=1 Tax=Polynucleobacter sp. AP-Capit-er-40B-B4 TaxID=2576927 RepID=UPI001C0B6A4D|nr:hypothetical protein [Polynucleobacter sp. AP-Capit-er-40B-B4]MBU3580785.1 hypothetical protein [Polynucleobacter sp. AP-Capit-er-40B-B4]
MEQNITKTRKPKTPRRVDPAKRDVRKADTTNLDVVKLARTYWEIADLLEGTLENLTLHNSQRKVNLALMYKCRLQAKSLWHHMEPPRKDCFVSYELTDQMYRAALEEEKRRISRESAAVPRTTEKIHFS